MIRTVSHAVPLALGLSLAAAALAPAHAQFGKLKKKAIATATEASGVPTKPPTYVKSVTMTPAQLKQLNAGLSAMIAKAPSAQKDYEDANKKLERETQDYEKARAEYDKKATSYNACVDRVTTAQGAKHDSLAAKVDQSLEANQMNQSQEDQLMALAAEGAGGGRAGRQRDRDGGGPPDPRGLPADDGRRLGQEPAGGQRDAGGVGFGPASRGPP